MANPFLGEIRAFSFAFAPTGWALCNGQTMQISQNAALFSLLGTTYGGNGVQTFQLPNLQGRVGIHVGGGFAQGQTAGEEAVALTTAQLPPHTHSVNAAANGTANASNVPGPTVVLGSGRADDTEWRECGRADRDATRHVADTAGNRSRRAVPVEPAR